MSMPLTQSNAAVAPAYAAHRAECFDVIEAFEKARRVQAEVEVGDASARFERDSCTFTNGCRELRALIAFVQRNTRLHGGLVQVHNETRSLLLEGSYGYAVVFGKRAGHDLGPLGDLLLATHQLDWRLGERAIAYSQLADDLVEAKHGAEAAFRSYADCGERAVHAARDSRDALRKKHAAVEARQKAYAARKPARGRGTTARGDLWLAENELRVACREAAQQQAHFVSQVAECETAVAALETWRDAQMDRFLDRFARINAVFRDDLARVGERLVKCGREAEFFKYTDHQSHCVKPKLDAARQMLDTAAETRAAQRERQAKIDATAKSKGALVFPPFPTDADFEDATALAHWPTPDAISPPSDGPQKSATAASAAARADPDSGFPAIPTMPRTALVAKKGALEHEGRLGPKSLGWSTVYVIVTYDGFVHAFPGRTEGAVELEAASFSVDLAAASVVDEEESPVITLSTKRHALVAYVAGHKEYKLRCKDAAEKFAWLRAFDDPLALYAPPDAPPPTPPPPDPPKPPAPGSPSRTLL